jgi:hypothetical protein
MSANRFFEQLVGRFSTLGDYLKDLQSQQSGDRNALCERITQWGSKRIGVISMAGVSHSPAMFVASSQSMTYDAAVDVHGKRVEVACDINGLAARSREQAYRSFDDADIIKRINGVNSDPFAKAEFILGYDEADRIIGEMMMIEKREFFWCFVHGLVHAMNLDRSESIYAACSHGRLVGVGERYESWPSIRVNSVDSTAMK